MSDIDPIHTNPQQPIDPSQPARPEHGEVKPISSAKHDAIDDLFGEEVSPEDKKKFKENMLKMVQTEIQRMEKKAKEAAKHMRDVIEGRE